MAMYNLATPRAGFAPLHSSDLMRTGAVMCFRFQEAVRTQYQIMCVRV